MKIESDPTETKLKKTEEKMQCSQERYDEPSKYPPRNKFKVDNYLDKSWLPKNSGLNTPFDLFIGQYM